MNFVILSLSVLTASVCALSFQWPDLSPAFNIGKRQSLSFRPQVPSSIKKALLQSVSNTNNGKTATVQQQKRVLSIVGEIEKSYPPADNFFTDAATLKLLNGTWYLQYTSPSVLDDFNTNVWLPQAKEDTVPTESTFQARGTISAVGITVETSNRVVKQSIDVDASQVFNEVELNFGKVTVGGRFRPSEKVANRAVVCFSKCIIELNNGLILDLGFVFSFIAFIRKSADNGWLETTFLDEDIRIGRGNKGTMFVLTRDPQAGLTCPSLLAGLGIYGTRTDEELENRDRRVQVGKRKYDRGHHVGNGNWVFAGIDKKKKRWFAVVVPTVPMIQAFILPGSDIQSDLCEAYMSIEARGYGHTTVNHSLEYVEHTT